MSEHTPDAADTYRLPLDAFVRSVAVKRGMAHVMFLGAGASISSGVPSAEDCIREWKRTIFLSRNPNLGDQFRELTVPSVVQRIQRWLDQQGGYPPQGDASEYGFYIERCYPIADDRRAFFDSKISTSIPSAGYNLLALLSRRGIIGSVWTTNFDDLPARACAGQNLSTYQVGLDSVERIDGYRQGDKLLCVSLHGDYRYDQLRNTPEELRASDATLRAALKDHVKDKPLIVMGYSGRDESVMETLRAAYSSPGTGSLYWCGYGGDIPKSVEELFAVTHAAGRSAFYVSTQGFDDLLWRISVQSLPVEDQPVVQQLTVAMREREPRAAFALPDWPITGLIKSNAFEIECPSELFEIELKSWPAALDGEGHWDTLRRLAGNTPLILGPLKSRVLAIGTLDDIKQALPDDLVKNIVRTPISDRELGYEDGVVVSLLRSALIRAMAAQRNLGTDGRSRLWRVQSFIDPRLGAQVTAQQAARCFLRRIGGRTYFVLKPTLRLIGKDGEELPRDLAHPQVMLALGYQHNAEFNQVMDQWRDVLFAGGTQFEFPMGAASPFRFSLRKTPVFASVSVKNGRPVPISPKIAPHVRYKGAELEEPQLLFAKADGSGSVADSHPIRGIVANRPFDYSLTKDGLAPDVTVGVVCPTSHQQVLTRFLATFHQQKRVDAADREYLMDFSGFESVFRTPLRVPSPGDAAWTACPEPSTGNPIDDAHELGQHLVRAIERLHASQAPSVILVFVPNRWEPWKRIDTPTLHFDLHDHVKAFSVERGIATQFLEESTPQDPQPCRVLWWLSLALYVKAMRTPWILRAPSDDTAFVGLGFRLDPKAAKGSHILLGCSHIYNARGEGMEYRLSKIENPIIRRRNPFMSREDAARVGRTIRELFFKSRGCLPGRVVLHKVTPFIEEERLGLYDGLSGVKAIDLIEINAEAPLRYVASKYVNGKFDEDNYPVKRGTVVRLDDYTALLWVHGVAAALDPRRRYYLGKRRIPAPLLIRRHAGESELATLAEEILGLSKMDWNSFDLYQKLPATVQSSGEIARIGSLLQRFGNLSYDYRLFI